LAVALRPRGAAPAGGRAPRRRVRLGRGFGADLGGERRGAGGTGPGDAPRRPRAAAPQLLRDRRLPDLSGPVPLRPRAPGPGRAAPLADLRIGAPQGGPGVPSPTR